MTERIDALLKGLKTAALDRDLSRLESHVWARIDRKKSADIFAGRGFQIQLAVTCGALLIGLAIAEISGMEPMTRPLNSEIVVLSDDGQLAPSVRLEGGI